jgi:putative transposase
MWRLVRMRFCANGAKRLALRRAGYGGRCCGFLSLKKTTRYAERNHEERICYIRELRRLLPIYGAENLVYVDESGFETHSYRPHGWAARGQKIYGNIASRNRKCCNLIMALRDKEWLAPMLFTHSCDSLTVTAWMKQALLPELRKPSIIVMDNAPFHPKERLRRMAEEAGHHLLFLPRYSPDFNPIEQSFAILKRRRQFAPITTEIQSLLMGNYKIK